MQKPKTKHCWKGYKSTGLVTVHQRNGVTKQKRTCVRK